MRLDYEAKLVRWELREDLAIQVQRDNLETLDHQDLLEYLA